MIIFSVKFPYHLIPYQVFSKFLVEWNNLLLTEREGCTGEYWPEVVAVWTEHSKVCTKTSEGQLIFPNTVQSKLSEVSKLFITWHRFFEQSALHHLVNVCILCLPSANFEWQSFTCKLNSPCLHGCNK